MVFDSIAPIAPTGLIPPHVGKKVIATLPEVLNVAMGLLNGAG